MGAIWNTREWRRPCFILAFALLQTQFALWGPATSMVHAQDDVCSQDSFLNAISCGDLVYSDCSRAGTGADPNLAELLTRNHIRGWGPVPMASLDFPETLVATADAAECCATCAARLSCNAWIFGTGLAGPNNPTNCYLVTSAICNYVTVESEAPPPTATYPFGQMCPDCTWGGGANLAQGRCAGGVITLAPPPVPTPSCQSINVTAEADCTAPIPFPSAVYDGAQLTPEINLNPLVINDDAINPPARLGVGTYSYSLTASSAYATSSACTGVIRVDPAPVTVFSCNPTVTILADQSSCAASIPNPTAVLNDPESAVGLALTLTVETNPASLVVGTTYQYTLTVNHCGDVTNVCSGSITVQASAVPTPSCTHTVTFAAISGCGHPPPSVADVYTDVTPPPYPLALIVDDNPTTLLVGDQYSYSLTASSACGMTSDPCTGTVTVRDAEPLDPNLISCPGFSTITPPDVGKSNPVVLATYRGGSSKANGCGVALAFPDIPRRGVMTCDRCIKPGRHESPSCAATVSGNQLTMTNVGGVGNYISWSITAADGLTAVTKTCGVCVDNPAKGGVCKAGWVAGNPAPC